MQYQGNRQISTYMSTFPDSKTASSKLISAAGNIPSNWKGYDSYPAPSPLRRTLTTIPWSPSVYYSTAKVNHSVPSASKLPVPSALSNHMSQIDEIRTPALFSAARNSLYTRYTHGDWDRHKRNISADQVRATGERLRFETCRLASELDDKTKRTAADVANKLGSRINDIQYWKSELEREIGEMIAETAQLDKARRALEIFLKESHNQKHIAKECLYHREKRQGIDLVHDDPEAALVNEIDLTTQLQEAAQAQLNDNNVQMNLNRAAQHELESDSLDKHTAANIDSAAFQLRNSSRGIAVHRGVERIDNTVSVPESWAEYTHGNVSRSQVERQKSKQLRNNTQSLLNHANEQLWRQWNKVNVALSKRIQETTEARNKIQKHLSGTLQELFDTEKSIGFLKKAITDKVDPLKVATSRLSNRLHRPNVEACRDAAQSRLVQEVYEIDESIESLTGQLRNTENQLQALLRKRSDLEHDLTIKNNTLFIDNEKCMGMRKTYPIQNRVWQLA